MLHIRVPVQSLPCVKSSIIWSVLFLDPIVVFDCGNDPDALRVSI